MPAAGAGTTSSSTVVTVVVFVIPGKGRRAERAKASEGGDELTMGSRGIL